jgi:hypothetical protein
MPSRSNGLPEIRTEADLAMFNQFMLSLGRDAVVNNDPYQAAPTNMAHAPSFDSGSISTGTGSPLSDESPLEDLFNAEELASLGLAGMPGIPIPTIQTSTQSHDMTNSLPSNSSISFANLYPSLDNLHLNRARTNSAPDVTEINKRTIANLPRNNSVATNRQDYANPAYFNSTPNPYPELPSFPSADNNQFNFDTLARSRAPMQTPTMAPRDFQKKTYRHVAPLGAAMSSRLHESAERTEFDDDEQEYDSPEDMPTPKISVRSLLLSDEQSDPAFKLPAINMMPIRSASGSGTPLPDLGSVIRQAPAKRHTEDEILRGVKRLELDDASRPTTSAEMKVNVEIEMRRRHAQMIRGWLVAVNLEWKRKELERTHKEEVGRLSSEMRGVEDVDEDGDEECSEMANDSEEEGEIRDYGGRQFSSMRMREIVGI